MNYLFTSESVSEGHPDKVADRISDAILDEFLARDPQSHVACETMVTTGQIIVAGEVGSEAYVDIAGTARRAACEAGYDRPGIGFDGNSCGVLLAVHNQSADIARGVRREEPSDQGAGDQGMMFGYATDETDRRIPLTLALSHELVKELANIRREGEQMRYLRPDSKSQVTVEYTPEGEAVRVDTIVVSTQHDEFITPAESGLSQEECDKAMQQQIEKDIKEILLPRVMGKLSEANRALFDDSLRLLVNPTGKFVVGGPDGDTGLTGRKIIVDTYGGRGAHGGGAFSGKDPSKVDRYAAYAARHIALNLVAAGVCRRALVQVAYAIGVSKPVSLYVDTYNTAKVNLTDGEISRRVARIFDMTPAGIERRLKLRAPIYTETSAYGHVGRNPRMETKTFRSDDGTTFSQTVELFTWEKPDMVEAVKAEFGI